MGFLLQTVVDYLPINNDEKDPFIDGLERTMIATTFPIRPKIEMRFMKMPSWNGIRKIGNFN